MTQKRRLVRSIVKEQEEKKKQVPRFRVTTLRIPLEFSRKISDIIEKEITSKSRNDWIIEAISEKLSRSREK